MLFVFIIFNTKLGQQARQQLISHLAALTSSHRALSRICGGDIIIASEA
jgi:hypothetical protein